MSTNRPNASIWDDDEGEAQLRPMMRKNNAHLFDDEPPVSSLSAASAASAAAAVAGYTASSAAEANAASALSAPSAYSVGSASSALSARSAGSAYSAASASSAAVPSAASAAAPEAADAVVSAPTPDSAGSAPLSARSGATPDAAPNAASAQSGAPNAASAPAMPPSQAPKSAPSAPVNGPVLGTTPSVHVPASSLANNGVPAMLANTPPATGRRYTNAENAHTSGTFDSAARRATATSATASTGASALTAASAAAASVTAQSPASATSANAPELADAAKPAVADAGAANPGSGAVRRRSLFTAVPQPVPVDEDSDDETIQVPVVREDLIPDSFSAASAVSASAASASATSAAESASAAETVSAAETTSAAETSSSVSAASAPSSLEHSSAATSPASASDDVALAPAATPAPAVTVPTPESTVQESAAQADQEAVDSVQELNDAHEVEAAAVPLPTDFDAPSAISIPTPPHTVSSALSAESTFSIDSAVSAASAASSVGITLPSAATPAPAVPVTPAPAVPVTPAAGATDTASNELSKTTPAADAPEPPAPPAPEQPEATSVEADFADDEVVASDHTETTIMDAADMELEEVVKPVVTSTSPVGVERLDHLATADSADLAPVAPSPSSAIFASTRTAAFSDSANQSDADNEVDDDVLLAGSTVVGKPASRAAAHWGGTLLALVLFPIAWFLMHTAANALTGALADGWPKVFSTAGIIELGMAIVLLIVVMATATRSSLGTFVTGITTLLIGLPFVVVPSITKQYLGDFLANMALQSRFGRILSEAILLDGVSGRLVIIGLFLIMLGVVSHSTRRAGRRERLVMDRANTKK